MAISPVKLTFTDTGKVKANMAILKANASPAAAKALQNEGERIFKETQIRVPVDTGLLQSTGRLNRPRRNANIVAIDISYGGGACDYAIYVHEDLTKHHPNGQAKFISRAMGAARAGFSERVGASFTTNVQQYIK